MATRDHITGKQSRRELLRRAGGATLTIAAAGTSLAATSSVAGAAAPDDPDAALLALADRFWREHRRYATLRRRSEQLRIRAENDPDFPGYGPDQDDRYWAFMRERGVTAAWRAWDEAFERLKEQAPAIFALPARTPAGVLAKLRIFGVAYGIDETGTAHGGGGDVGDEDLYAISEGWLASAVHDLEAIVGAGAAGA